MTSMRELTEHEPSCGPSSRGCAPRWRQWRRAYEAGAIRDIAFTNRRERSNHCTPG